MAKEYPRLNHPKPAHYAANPLHKTQDLARAARHLVPNDHRVFKIVTAVSLGIALFGIVSNLLNGERERWPSGRAGPERPTTWCRGARGRSGRRNAPTTA